MNYGIIVAAGKSERMGPEVDKAFLSLGTKPVLAYSLAAFEKCHDIDAIILVVRKDRVDAARGLIQIYSCSKVKKIVAGGAQRQQSVLNGIEALNSDDVKIVAIHDGARPCITPELISATIASAKANGSGVAAIKVTDTIKSADAHMNVEKTIDRTRLWAVQTPQTFKLDVLMKAFDAVKKKKAVVTDEASAVELICGKVKLVPSAQSNIKITTPEDLTTAAAFLKI